MALFWPVWDGVDCCWTTPAKPAAFLMSRTPATAPEADTTVMSGHHCIIRRNGRPCSAQPDHRHHLYSYQSITWLCTITWKRCDQLHTGNRYTAGRAVPCRVAVLGTCCRPAGYRRRDHGRLGAGCPSRLSCPARVQPGRADTMSQPAACRVVLLERLSSTELSD